jgi:hypothetical protein
LQIFIIDGLSLDHLEHFVLNHSECIPVGRTAEGSIALLTDFVFSAAVVRSWKVCVTVLFLIAVICDNNVMSSSECWTPIWAIPNCFSLLPLYECHFLPEIELQQEGTSGEVSNRLTIWRSPFERSVGDDGFAELSADDSNSIRNIIAELMKFGSLKIMLRGAK